MAKPWADMTSAERLDAVLRAVAELNAEDRDATGNAVAYRVGLRHSMLPPRHGNHGTGNVARRMSEATRVTPALTALRNRGWITFSSRMDGMTGSADWITPEGEAHLRGEAS